MTWQQDENVSTFARFTATKWLHMTMMLMMYALSNELIGQSASYLECQGFGLWTPDRLLPIESGGQKWVGTVLLVTVYMVTVFHSLHTLCRSNIHRQQQACRCTTTSSMPYMAGLPLPLTTTDNAFWRWSMYLQFTQIHRQLRGQIYCMQGLWKFWGYLVTFFLSPFNPFIQCFLLHMSRDQRPLTGQTWVTLVLVIHFTLDTPHTVHNPHCTCSTRAHPTLYMHPTVHAPHCTCSARTRPTLYMLHTYAPHTVHAPHCTHPTLYMLHTYTPHTVHAPNCTHPTLYTPHTYTPYTVYTPLCIHPHCTLYSTVTTLDPLFV